MGARLAQRDQFSQRGCEPIAPPGVSRGTSLPALCGSHAILPAGSGPSERTYHRCWLLRRPAKARDGLELRHNLASAAFRSGNGLDNDLAAPNDFPLFLKDIGVPNYTINK